MGGEWGWWWGVGVVAQYCGHVGSLEDDGREPGHAVEYICTHLSLEFMKKGRRMSS